MATKKIAILGGGMSSLVTAYELTNVSGWDDSYEITVYQQGWRLGGKGASGRGRDDRIEEHGLHILFGSYENTFRILRACYEELAGKGWPWAFADAFKGGELVVMFEEIAGKWEPWELRIAPTLGEPGVGAPVEMSPLGMVKALISWLIARLRDLFPALPPPGRTGTFGLGEARSLDQLLEADGPQSEEEALRYLVAAEDLLAAADTSAPAGDFDALAWAGGLGGIGNVTAAAVERVACWLRRRKKEKDRDKRRRRIVLDYGFAALTGVLRKKVLLPRPDWFAIDRYDLRDFLQEYGAEDETLASPLVLGSYYSIFSAEARAGAGTVLHGLLRSFLRKGSIFYRMQAGMGDVVFAPLFEVLRSRGVRFEFFHRVEDVQLSADRRRVAAIRFDQQVALTAKSYTPLRKTKVHKDDGSEILLPCWPSAPDYSQMKDDDGKKSKRHDLEGWWDSWRGAPKTLHLGKDFDLVVLGISVGALPFICRELMEDPANPRFYEMALSVRTVQTQAVQLWMERDLPGLGWTLASPIVIPFARSFDTWADMSHLLRRENLPASVLNVAYLCSSLPDDEPLPPRMDHDYPRRQRARVLENAQSWLKSSAHGLWPKVAAQGSFDWKALHGFGAPVGPGRLEEQHYCATVNPSDRYVLSVPGSSAKRLRADESGYENLVLTGDWTLTAFSAGCLEAATMSGIQAARAIDPRVPAAANDWLPASRAASKTVEATTSPYVIRDGEMLVVPPVELKMSVDAFFVRADYDRLVKLCDNHLNHDPKRRYRPVGPFVVFYCAAMSNIVPSGSIAEDDFGIWVPVYGGEGLGKDFEASRILTYSPYLWVDNSPALVGGRTVFGFPKHIAKMTAPELGKLPCYSADTYVTRIQGGEAKEERLLEITGSRPWTGHTKDWSGPKPIDAKLELLLGTLHHLPKLNLGLVRQLLASTGGMPMVFLKQFPEVDGTWNAAYQALIEGPIEITGGLKSGDLEGPFEVALLECWSHDIAATLGLRIARRRPVPNGTMSVMDVPVASWAEFRAEVSPGRVMWKGGA